MSEKAGEKKKNTCIYRAVLLIVGLDFIPHLDQIGAWCARQDMTNQEHQDATEEVLVATEVHRMENVWDEDQNTDPREPEQ